jgi:hypothetical protein
LSPCALLINEPKTTTTLNNHFLISVSLCWKLNRQVDSFHKQK